MSTPIHTEQGTTRWRGSAPTSPATTTSSTGSNRATVAGLEEILERTRDLPRDSINASTSAIPTSTVPRARSTRSSSAVAGSWWCAASRWTSTAIDENERLFWAGCRTSVALLSNNSFGHRMVRVQQEVLPERGAAGAGHEVRRRARHAQRLRRPLLPAVDPPGRAGRREPVLERPRRARHHPRHPPRHPARSSTAGFPHHRRSEQPDHQPDVTPYDVPIFSDVDGRDRHQLHLQQHPPRAARARARAHTRGGGGDRDPPPRAGGAAGRAAHAAGRRVDGEQLRPVPLALRLRRRPRPRAPAAGAAGVERGADSRTGGCPIGREFFHMENEGGRLGYDLGARPRGPHRDQRLQQRRRGPRRTCSRPRRPSPSSADRATCARVSSTSTSGPTRSRGRSWPTTVASTSPAWRSPATGRRELGGAGAGARLPVAHPHRAGPQPGRRRAVDLRPRAAGALPRPAGGVLGRGGLRHHRRRRVHRGRGDRVQQLGSRSRGSGRARARVHAHAGEEDRRSPIA